jgi:hypothetical protein
MRSFIFVISWLFLFHTTVDGQSAYSLGILPNLNTGIALNSQWKINTKLESRFKALSTSASESQFHFEFERVDIALILNRKTGSRNAVGAGYLVRFSDRNVTHRAIQQYVFGREYSVVSIAHRFSADQTFRTHVDPTFRFRYRIGFEIPLSGRSLDPCEWSLKLTNEYLKIFQGRSNDLEVRAQLLTGYLTNQSNSVEIGLEYRVCDIFKEEATHAFWLNLGSFIKF